MQGHGPVSVLSTDILSGAPRGRAVQPLGVPHGTSETSQGLSLQTSARPFPACGHPLYTGQQDTTTERHNV